MATSGYSATPIYKKLGVKENFVVCLINAPDNYEDYLGTPFPAQFIRGLEEQCDIVHGFFHTRSDLMAQLDDMRTAIHKKGMVWISWPKGQSKLPTDLNRDWIRNYILDRGLVDVKVASYNEIYSGLKFVYRLKDR